MKRKKSTDDIYKECFIEMFKRVGEKYPNEELTKDPNWYMLRQWTVKQEENFKKWMIIKLRVSYKYMKQEAIMSTNWFLFQYGWTTRQLKHMMVIKK